MKFISAILKKCDHAKEVAAAHQKDLAVQKNYGAWCRPRMQQH